MSEEAAAKFTPGPWVFRPTYGHYDDEMNEIVPPEVEPGFSACSYSGNPSIIGADGTSVVGCDEYNVFHGPNQAANVRLLLAAPDLLAALQEIARNEITVFDEAEGDYVVVSMEPDEMVDIARNAIAKATGAAK